MSDTGSSWLATRQPHPPERLAAALASAPEAPGLASAADPAARELADAGLGALRRALALGDVRPAAYELLLADALLTYAIERAAEDGVDALAAQLAELAPAELASLIGAAP